jgi:sodium transport system permease protein
VSGFKIALLVAARELTDLLRDPRSLLISLGLPLLLFPLLFLTIGSASRTGTADAPQYRVTLSADSPLVPLLEKQPALELSLLTSPPQSDAEIVEFVYGSSADIFLRLRDEKIEIHYDNSDQGAAAAANYLQQALSAETAADSQSIAPPLLLPFYSSAKATGRLLLGIALPFMVFIFAASCPLPIAADLSAGEKERGSLEPLLASAAPRGAIAAGKLIAAAVAGFASVCAFVSGVGISLLINPAILGPDPVVISFSATQFLILPLLTLLVTAIFASLELAAGIATRSVREAQLLGMPLLLIAGGAVHLAQQADLKNLAWYYPHLPLVNLALGVRLTALDRIDPLLLLTITAWGLCYLAVAVWLSQRLFRSETTVLKR